MATRWHKSWDNPNLLDEDGVETASLPPSSPSMSPLQDQGYSTYNTTNERSYTRDAVLPQRQSYHRRSDSRDVSPVYTPLSDPHFQSPTISAPRSSRVQNHAQRPFFPTGSIAGSRVVMAIDYGTTYTGLAVAQTRSGHADLDEIEVLQDWGPNGDNQSKVRTMISYVKSSTGETQWGSAVSNLATAMVNTKLELQPQSSRFDELELTYYLLTGTGNLAFEHLQRIGPDPAYPSASPTEIVQDYLSHIRESACRKGVLKKVDLSRLVETKTPLDIVVTVPAKWSYQATDATFKAVRGAGFNKQTFPTLRDTILVSEPEAASFFAIRDHQASSGVQLQVGDCFILCDAGGGTVDVVSYQVTKVEPQLEIERATEPDSRKCGSTFIDTAFKKWLRNELGVDNYAKLDPINAYRRLNAHTLESGSIRRLVQDFIIRKQAFSQTSEDIRLDLPEPLNAMHRGFRVREGELTISSQEMCNFFEDSSCGVIDLMDSQIKKLVKAKNRRARNVFLVGGFGASPYLQNLLDESLGLRRNAVLRRPDPDKSLTAVVRGAVIYGIEKARHNNVKYMWPAKDSYAICLDGSFHWLIRKDDLVLSTQKRSAVSKGFFLLLKNCPAKKFEVPIYKYYSRNDADDDIPESWEDGQHDVEEIGAVKCDVSTLLDHDLRIPQSQQKKDTFEIGPFVCHFQLSQTSLVVDILHRTTVLARNKFSHKTNAQRNATRNEWS